MSGTAEQETELKARCLVVLHQHDGITVTFRHFYFNQRNCKGQ